MEEINPGEIVYTDLFVKDQKEKIHELRKVVFSRNWKCQYPFLEYLEYTRFLKQHSIKSDVTIVDVKIITRTGFKHKNKGSTSAKKNEQTRDKVTGAYV